MNSNKPTLHPPAIALFDIEPLRAVFVDGVQQRLLLTPNRRLASRIRTALVSAAHQHGQATVQTPVVQALTDWLETLWQQLLFSGNAGADCWVLSAEQERVLWESIIRASPLGASLLRPGQTAELAASALRTLVLWRQWPVPASQHGYFSDADTAAFLDWLEIFEMRCAEQGCITQAERDLRVITALAAGQLVLPMPITMVCFDEIAPLYAELLAAPIAAELIAIPPRNRVATRVACDSFEQQIRAAIRWISAQMQSGAAGPFAIVVPDLNAQRARVQRMLLDELNPSHLLPATSRQLPPVNFSAGEPLAEVPIIQTALRLLSLWLPEMERADVLALLQSPFFGDRSERTEDTDAEMTTQAIADICDLLTDTISGTQLRSVTMRIAEKFSGWNFDHALQALADYSRRQHLSSLRAPMSTWAEHMRAGLALFGWPGPRTLDSLEYQQVSQWLELLGELSAFDEIAGALSLSKALTLLRQLAQSRVFQPKTPDAPIQVLGLLEAAGLQFEGVWLCEMADNQWPPPASPHPLLPRDWQRRLRMPHCDAEREFSVAQQLSHSLRANTRQLIVSYQHERDDVERRISPLFNDLVVTNLAALGLNMSEPFKPEQAELSNANNLRRFDPGIAPPLNLSVRARGGSALLADQAACPFRAFARHRLGAEPLSEPQTGLSASERGTLLHAALQQVWRVLQNSEILKRCDDLDLTQHADHAAQQTITTWSEAKRFGARFLQLETERLSRVLQRWLTLEQERAEFSIAALEDERRFNFAGLDLRLRVDRIDRLPDGRVTIVDYKSGQGNSANAWLGERPEQPQLPLYALALQHEQSGSVAGVLFAQVRLDQPKWVGIGADDLENYSLKPAHNEFAADWAAQLQLWQTALENLANEFIQGRADVAPASPKSCQYCALPTVCRIAHEQLEFAGESELADEEGAI